MGHHWDGVGQKKIKSASGVSAIVRRITWGSFPTAVGTPLRFVLLSRRELPIRHGGRLTMTGSSDSSPSRLFDGGGQRQVHSVEITHFSLSISTLSIRDPQSAPPRRTAINRFLFSPSPQYIVPSKIM